MRISTLHRVATSFAILTVGALAETGCADVNPVPTASRARPALAARVPSAHGKVIRQRVADKRGHGLTSAEKGRAKALKGKWQWAADLHHAAMQDAMHDRSLGGLRQQRTVAERCAISVRYLTKYYPQIEARSGKQNESEADRTAAIHRLALETGACPATSGQASVFGASIPRFTRSASSERANASVILTADGQVNADQTSAAWRDYVVAMTADIRQAKDLDDAKEILDSYLVTASDDPGVNQASLAIIAGTVDLATSSADEWDSFARPREGSMFMWGWLSDIGNWVSEVISGDINGCIAGVEVEFAAMGAGGYYGTLSEFAQVTEYFCAGGAIIGSLWAAI